MMLGYVIYRGNSVALMGDGRGNLHWMSDMPGLAERAEYFVPANEIPEHGGNPAAWAVRKLALFLPGQTGVMGANVMPGDANYGLGPQVVPSGSSPFSEARPFCQEGRNKGKPGPCPLTYEQYKAEARAQGKTAERAISQSFQRAYQSLPANHPAREAIGDMIREHAAGNAEGAFTYAQRAESVLAGHTDEKLKALVSRARESLGAHLAAQEAARLTHPSRVKRQQERKALREAEEHVGDLLQNPQSAARELDTDYDPGTAPPIVQKAVASLQSFDQAWQSG